MASSMRMCPAPPRLHRVTQPPPEPAVPPYLGRRTCTPASSSCRSHTGSSSAPCASPCTPPGTAGPCQTSTCLGALQWAQSRTELLGWGLTPQHQPALLLPSPISLRPGRGRRAGPGHAASGTNTTFWGALQRDESLQPPLAHGSEGNSLPTACPGPCIFTAHRPCGGFRAQPSHLARKAPRAGAVPSPPMSNSEPAGPQ